ncbi:hypothetical protein D3C87_1521770 [compost metagenome]
MAKNMDLLWINEVIRSQSLEACEIPRDLTVKILSFTRSSNTVAHSGFFNSHRDKAKLGDEIKNALIRFNLGAGSREIQRVTTQASNKKQGRLWSGTRGFGDDDSLNFLADTNGTIEDLIVGAFFARQSASLRSTQFIWDNNRLSLNRKST